MTLRLHCFGESGNAYKAALTLQLAGIDWEPVFVDFFRGATRTPAFRALNVMGEVPVLEVPGAVLTQSGVMQMWIAERHPALFAGNRDEALRWVLYDNHKLSGQIGALRFNRNFLPEDRRNPAVNDHLEARVHSALKVLDTALGDRPFLLGDRVSIADTACCGYLYYPEPWGFDRADWPAIDRWLTAIAALPGWRHPYDLMPRAWPGAASPA